ncbi:hypothetical protein GCM10027068_52300 [Prescottella soli]
MSLAGEELAEGVADVDDADVAGVESGIGEGALDDLAHEVRDIEPLAGEVSCEIRLVAADYSNRVSSHVSRSLLEVLRFSGVQTTTSRVMQPTQLFGRPVVR